MNRTVENAARCRVLLGALICVWAISWPVMKVGIGAVPPLWFGCLRYLIGACVLFPFVGLRRGLALPPRQDWPLIVVSGTLQMGAFSGLVGLGLTFLPPGRASILAYSTPLLVVPLAAWHLKEHLSRRAVVGVAAGLVGIAVIVTPSFQTGRNGQAMGNALIMGAAAIWAISIVYVRAHSFAASALELAPWQMLVATLLLFPAAVLTEGAPQPIGATGLMTLAYIGSVATAFGYWAMVEVGRHLPASTISMALLAVPCLGMSISSIALGETLTMSFLMGVVLIVTGMRLAANS